MRWYAALLVIKTHNAFLRAESEVVGSASAVETKSITTIKLLDIQNGESFVGVSSLCSNSLCFLQPSLQRETKYEDFENASMALIRGVEALRILEALTNVLSLP